MITIESLPRELLMQICSHLAFIDLQHVSLVNRHVRSCCFPHLFHTVALRLDSSENFHWQAEELKDIHVVIAELKEASQHSQWLRMIQHLKVMPTAFDDVADGMNVYKSADGIDDHGIRPRDPWKYCRPGFWMAYTDAQWQALIDFIAEDLPSMKDFTWACLDQLPLNVLRYLNTRERRPRLHLRSFDLQSAEDESDEISAHDLEVITSPCLHSVSVVTTHSPAMGDVNLVVPVLHHMVAGAAPNLKELNHSWRIQRRSCIMGQIIVDRTQEFLRPLRQLSPIDVSSGDRRGKLTSLALEGIVRIDQPHPISIWARYTDFSVLESLKLYCESYTDLFTHYDKCGQKLSALKSFAYSAVQSKSLYNTTFFILTLPPLTELEIHDWNELDLQGICLNKILRHCRSSLCRLYCPDIVVERQKQEELRILCPKLEVMEFQSDKIRPYRRVSAMQHSHLTRSSSPTNERALQPIAPTQHGFHM